MTHQGPSADKEYIESSVWQCRKSPTGAHHWVEGPNYKWLFICKWCGEHRNFSIPSKK
jgi:hypothetical protein